MTGITTNDPPTEERYLRLGKLWPTLNDVPVLRSWHHHDDIMRLSDYRGVLRAVYGFRGNVAYWLRMRRAYGSYDLADGRQLIFNREYEVIGERRDAATLWQPSKYQWDSDVKDTSVITTTWFYDDGCPPWRNNGCFKRFQLVLRLQLEQPRPLSPPQRRHSGRHLNGKGTAAE